MRQESDTDESSPGPTSVSAELDALLRSNVDAVVSAIGSEAVQVPMPLSVPLYGQSLFEGFLGLELVVADDQLAVVDGWARAQHEPIVRFDVHFLADPEQVSIVHFFDVRAEHGVHVVVLEVQDQELLARSQEVGEAKRRRVARAKKDGASVFLEVDDATTSLLGWSAADLVGHSTVEFVHPDDVPRAVDDWMAMRAGTGSGRARVRYRHADGHHVWIEVTNENCLDDPELRCVMSEMVDISKEMEQLEALTERERLLARLAEALPIGICHLRPDRKMLYWNEPLIALLGPVDSIDALKQSIAAADWRNVELALDHAFRGRPGSVDVGVTHGSVERRCELTFRALTGDTSSVDGVIVCAADVTERSRLRAELEHRASHDALTGCLNRAAATLAIERALLESRQVAVAYIDLDHFKAINDALGHAAGDELLRVAAARLHNATRVGDHLARLGGDEFGVICTRGEEPFNVENLVDRLAAAINGDFVFAKQRIPLRASVGVAISSDGELDAEAVLHRADTAMYASKRRARAQASVESTQPVVELAARRSEQERARSVCPRRKPADIIEATRVLLVDDEVSMRNLLRLTLENDQQFCVVGEAPNGREAVALALEHQPDLILLDLAMPGVGGLEALPRIRAVAPQAQVVILSGLDPADAADQLRGQGAIAYLCKGADPTRYVDDLRRLLAS